MKADSERNTRIEKLLALLTPPGSERTRVDALLVSALPNVHYLSGFTGSNALLLIDPAGPVLFTDPRYTLQAAEQSKLAVRIAKGPISKPLIEVIKRRKIKKLGIERNRISFEEWDTLRTELPAGTQIVPLSGVVEELRMVKAKSEIELIRSSVETNSRALRRALKSFRSGMRETEFAAEIDHQARRAGAQAPAFETIVASNARSALPHARPTSAKIGDKGILLIDMGSMENGYASDMTRTLHIGKASKRFKTVYRAVLDAQLAALDAVRPGVTAEEVDRAARRTLEKSGFGKEFVHSTGHGLGLEIHEGPRMGKKSKTILQNGFVITIEPGVYFQGYGGVRIEDAVVVTEKGCEVLTPTSKEMVEW